MDTLSPAVARFVLHWGEMSARWGVNRTVAWIHALLFATGRPMHADELCEALGVARSNVSTCLRELQAWNLVRLVHRADDRRDHYETSSDVWDLMRTIVRERQRREIAPTIGALAELLADPATRKEPADFVGRIQQTLSLLETLSAWSDEMLTLDPATLVRVARLGARIQQLLAGARSGPGRAGKAGKAAGRATRPSAIGSAP